MSATAKNVVKVDEAVAMVVEHADGWNNILTGLGIKGRDKRMSSDFRYERVYKNEVEELYGCDDMGEKAVDFLPEEMQREGFEIKHNLEDETLSDQMLGKYEDLEGTVEFDRGLKWARLYGGAGIIMGIKDGQDPAEPVDEKRIQSIEFLNTLHRWELHPLSTSIQRDPTKPMFGFPEQYRINPEVGGGENSTITVHHSRILRFDGARLPKNLFIRNNYWHDSVLNRFKNPLRNFQTGHDSAATLLHDFAQAVFKIKNLTEMIASEGGDQLVQKRMELVDACRSVVNAIIIEDGEEFERKVTSLQGLPEMLGKIEQRLVQASKMPHTVLLGEGPGGLGATGDSQKTDWFDYVARQQEINYKPQLEKFFRYCFLAKDGPTKGREPETWSIEFNPLWQMDQKEQADVDLKNAQADALYIDRAVLDPDEVAKSRFGQNEGAIQIDLEARDSQKFNPNPPNMDAFGDEGDPELMHDHVNPETGKYIGPGMDVGDGMHIHFGDGGPWKQARTGEPHVHESERTGVKSEESTPIKGTPQQKSDGGCGHNHDDIEAAIKTIAEGVSENNKNIVFANLLPKNKKSDTKRKPVVDKDIKEDDLTAITLPDTVKSVVKLDTVDVAGLMKLKKHKDKEVAAWATAKFDELKELEGDE